MIASRPAGRAMTKPAARRRPRRQPGRPRQVAGDRRRAGSGGLADELGAPAGRQGPQALDGCAHGGSVRAVARLIDRRLPAARQPLMDAFAERLGEVLVEERPEDDLVRVGDDRVAGRRVPARPLAGATWTTRRSTPSTAASRSGDRNRAIVATNAIGGDSASLSRSSSSGRSAGRPSRVARQGLLRVRRRTRLRPARPRATRPTSASQIWLDGAARWPG